MAAAASASAAAVMAHPAKSIWAVLAAASIAVRRPDQQRHDQLGFGRLDRAGERYLVDRIDHRGADRLEALGLGDEPAMPVADFLEMDLRQFDRGALDLFGRRDDLGGAVDGDLSVLIGDAALQQDGFVLRLLLFHRDADHDRVADHNGTEEGERLAAINRSRSGKFRAQHRGDQRAAPHAVGDDVVEQIVAGEFRVGVDRIDVARHGREDLDVALRQRAGQARGVADLDLIEHAIFDLLH